MMDEIVTFVWIIRATKKEIKEKEDAVKFYLEHKERMIEMLRKKGKPTEEDALFYKLAYLKAKESGVAWKPKKF